MELYASSKLTLSPVANKFQNREAEKQRNEVSNKNPLKEPINSTKYPAPTVPIIAANVPAVFDKPISDEKIKRQAYVMVVTRSSCNQKLNTLSMCDKVIKKQKT